MAIILDGKKLSQKILDELQEKIAQFKKKLRLAIVVVGKDPVVAKFIEQKKKTAESIGVDIRIYPFEEKITTNELRRRTAEIVHEEKNTGVIIQLPLPAHINTQYILNSVTAKKDVDMLSSGAIGSFVVGKSKIMSPVAGAILAFFKEFNINYHDKNIVILGSGNLVGRPVALWLLSERASFTLMAKDTFSTGEVLKNADIIISGIGNPKFITADKVKKGVIIIDAGTSESEGKLAGDADFDGLLGKASYITPVPGGIGPLTIAFLFKNLLTLGGLNKK